MTENPSRTGRNPALIFATAVTFSLLIATGIQPFDRLTWSLEIFPILIVFPLLWTTRKQFPLTSLLYWLIAVHAVILITGGAYSYARVPFGFEIAEWFGLDRNPYDKIGHFVQGFVPAIAAREILIRGEHIRQGKMLTLIVLSIVLAISAAYELIEWAAALLLGQGAEEFLGTQGYEWDTQSDMLFALTGGSLALLLLSQIHDKLIGHSRKHSANISRIPASSTLRGAK